MLCGCLQGTEVVAPAGSFMSPPLSTLRSDEEGEEDTLLFILHHFSRFATQQRPVLRLKREGGGNGLLPLLGFSEASLNINQVGVTQSHPPKDQLCDSDDDQTMNTFCSRGYLFCGTSLSTVEEGVLTIKNLLHSDTPTSHRAPSSNLSFLDALYHAQVLSAARLSLYLFRVIRWI